MRTFKHKNTGEILNFNESHSALSVVKNSPSWEEITEEVVEATPVDFKEVTEDAEADLTEVKAEETAEVKPKPEKKK